MGDLIQLHGDDPSNPILAAYSDRLVTYLDDEHPDAAKLRAIDLTDPPELPWPEVDNIMLEYLVARTAHVLYTEGQDAAIYWLASHAWREGALHFASEMADLLPD